MHGRPRRQSDVLLLAHGANRLRARPECQSVAEGGERDRHRLACVGGHERDGIHLRRRHRRLAARRPHRRSGEDHYEVAVFDAYGHLVWERQDIPSVSGDKNVTVPYGGPPLEAGMLYQFRATSIKNSGAPIARTEDLRGVFLYR